MSRRAPSPPWLRIVLGALVVALGSGVGLPGLVLALGPATSHVCTCASGGGHSSCPVCNPGGHGQRSPDSAVEGVPCGEKLGAAGIACEPAVIPSPHAATEASFACAKAVRDGTRAPSMAFTEPWTPPPRRAPG